MSTPKRHQFFFASFNFGFSFLLLLVIILQRIQHVESNDCLSGNFYKSIYMKESQTRPTDYNQMFVWFGSSTALFYIVDLERKSDEFKDIMVNYQHSSYSLVQNDTILQFGSQASLTCDVNIGLFSPISQSVLSYGCYKWIHYIRGYSYYFSEQENCTRVTLQSNSLTMILEKSEISYPSDTFQYDFLQDDSNWFSTNPEPSTELFVKFRNATEIEPTINRHDILTANFEMIIQTNPQHSECKDSAAQIKGQVEIFTKFSVISSSIETCIEGISNKCKLCSRDHIIHSLYGSLNSLNTTFSIQQYPTFRKGKSPHPFHPIVVRSSQMKPRGLSSLLEAEENLAIIICASIGGILFVLACSFTVVGLIYVSRRKIERRRPAYVPLK